MLANHKVGVSQTMDATRDAGSINYRVSERDLKYYIFDWDDNILRMPTRIHLLRRSPDGEWEPHTVSTAVFALVRNDTANYRPPEGDWENAFVEFRDLDPGGPSKFLEHTAAALEPVIRGETAPPPSFERFRQTLVEGRLFAIVTARGHRPESIRTGVRYVIDHVLSDNEKREMIRNLRGYLHFFERREGDMTDEEIIEYYLDQNQYHPCTSPQFKQRMQATGNAKDPERAKQLAIRDFVHHIVGMIRDAGIARPISIGFSDDDPGNVAAVEDYIQRELAREFADVSFAVYDTSDPGIPAGRKVIVHGQLKLEL